MNFMSIFAAVMRVAKVALPAIEAEMSGKAGEIVGASAGVVGSALDAVAAKGTPASVSAVTSAVATVASSAGLSSNDKANASGLAQAVEAVAPILASIGSALEPAHLDAITTGLSYTMALANGVTGGFAPPPAEPAPVAS